MKRIDVRVLRMLKPSAGSAFAKIVCRRTRHFSVAGTMVARAESANMTPRLKMMFWKCERLWVGKYIGHPEIMSQGKALDEHK